MSTNSIPTTGINGIRFRSRIEAIWAEMFTKLGWEWEYEPIDLNGYIPDFIIKFPYKHLLVEVKGDTDIKNIEQYADKIVKSGWDGEFLLVCSSLECDDDDNLYIGLLGATKARYSCGDFRNDEDYLHRNMDFVDLCGLSLSDYSHILPLVKNKNFANLSICECCKKYTMFDGSCGLYWCRHCGNSPCLTKNMIKKNDETFNKIKGFWIEAKNHSQWKGK
jgi:hypothetical protein